MDSATQSFMESRFGTDFSNVKIHTGDDAVQMSRALGAQAFTVGSDIYFNSGKYNPSSESGKHLLAHELTHTVQQVAPVIQRVMAAIDINAAADEIHAAVTGLGTDEERIFVNLQRLNRNAADIISLTTAYQARHGTALEAELRDEMSGSELRLALELIGINDNPALGNLVNAAAPSSAAQFTAAATRLRDAIEGPGTDEETIYAVLLPFNRDAVALAQLKTAYRTLTGRELQADIEGDMSAEELHYALYLLNGRPDESVAANTTETAAGTNQASGPVTGGSVDLNTGVGYTTGHANGFSMRYQGGISSDTRWLQFIWREMIVTRADGTTVALSDTVSNGVTSYNLTTDVSNPNYNTDTASTTTPFYEVGGATHIRTADATTIYDMPSSALPLAAREFGRAANPATQVISRSHFNTFLIRDYRPLHQMTITVEWTFAGAAEPPRVYSLNASNAVEHLPEGMRNRLIAQFPNYSYIQ
jgi:hypothetical protein